jgi:hypothetical protein
MKWNVTAVAMDRSTRQMKALPRVELINTNTNILFKGCKTPIQVEQVYEAFWNELNLQSDEIVKVIGLEFVK